MAEDTLQLVKMRNDFYRDSYRRVLLVFLVSLIINAIFIGLIYYMIANQPGPKYFATTTDGQVISLVPLDEPNIKTEALLQWTVEAATAAYSYNFANYRKALQDASAYFTPNGWDDYLKVLNESNNLAAVQAKKLVVQATPTGAPQILQEGIISGVYAWKVQMPMTVNYQSANEQIQQYLVVTMLIVRVPILNDPRGIGIAQFVAQGQ